jgi:hypothetical protein
MSIDGTVGGMLGLFEGASDRAAGCRRRPTRSRVGSEDRVCCLVAPRLGTILESPASVLIAGRDIVPNPVTRRPRTFLAHAVASHVNPPSSGGCEDFAMLNRKNQTLSALALSNRLDLGTRSLAANAGVNHGDQILCILHSSHDVMRDGSAWYVVSSIPKKRYEVPASPGSVSETEQRRFRRATVQQRTFPAGGPVGPARRPASCPGRLEPQADELDRKLPAIVPASWTATTRKSGLPAGAALKSSGIHGLKRPASRVTKPAATARSASSGK